MDNNVLVQKFNPATGNLEWELQRENYDYVQEIARSGKQNNFKIHPCCFFFLVRISHPSNYIH